MSGTLSAEKPFPGLRPYAFADHAWFFGRDEQSLALYRLVDRGRLVAVVGSSGSGKSSVVRAGLLPLLDEETRGEGGQAWRWWEMRPGDAPIARLAERLAGLAKGSETARAKVGARRERLGLVLRRSSFGLIDALHELTLPAKSTPLLLIDQFEELFRFADLPGTETARAGRREEAAAFVQLLLEATRATEWPIRVVLTMRSDFIGDCARFHALPEAVTASQFLVPALTRGQREEAIRGPIGRADGSVADDLVERLLNDSAEEFDQLPVLQHALNRTWHFAQAAGRRDLTLNDYLAIGGIEQAISRHANLVLDEKAMRKRQRVVEQVFRALTDLDRQNRGVRRPLTFGQLTAETGMPERDVRAVVNRLRSDDCSFLISPHAEDRQLEDKDIVDIGHEALIRRWNSLNRDEAGARSGWLWDEAADGRTYRGLLSLIDGAGGRRATLPFGQLQDRIAWWRSRQRTSTWAERYDGRLDEVERLFVHSRWRSRIARAAVIAVCLLLVGAISAVLYSWRKAEREAARANQTSATLIWSRLNLEGTDDPKSKASIEALWNLATRGDVRKAFMRQVPFDRYQIDILASGPALILRTFGLRPNSEEIQSFLGPVLDAIRQPTDRVQLLALAQAVQTLEPKLAPEQAKTAIGAALVAIGQTNDPDKLLALAQTVHTLGPSSEQAQAALSPVLDAIRQSTYRYDLGSLAQAVRALGPNLAPEQAQATLGSLLDAIRQTTDPDQLLALAQAVYTLGPSPEQAQATLGPVLDAIRQTSNRFKLRGLAQAVQALGPKLAPEQAQAALGPVLDAIRQTTDPDQLLALAQAVYTLEPSPEQAQATLGPVLDAIRQTTDADQLKALAQAVPHTATDPVSDAIRKTPSGVMPRATDLAVQTGALTPDQAQIALGPVLDAISWITDPQSLQALFRALQTFGSTLTPQQVQAAVGAVLDAIRQTTDPSALQALAQAVQILGPRLAPEQADTAIEMLRSVLASSDEPHVAEAFARAIAVTLPLDPTNAQPYAVAIVELLKWPTTAEPGATEALLQVLHDRMPEAPGEEVGLDATVQWIATTFPEIDLDSPPTYPASGSTGGAW